MLPLTLMTSTSKQENIMYRVEIFMQAGII